MKCPLPMIAAAFAALSAASLAADSPPLDHRNTAWAEADAKQLSGLYTQDARVMTPNFPSVVGRERIQAMVTRMMGRYMSIRSTVVEDVESGDLWVRRTDYEMVVGEHPVDDGEAVEVWRRVDGRWLLHLEIFTSRNIRPIAYDDPAPEYDRIRVRPAPDEPTQAPTAMRSPVDSAAAEEGGAADDGPTGQSDPPADPPGEAEPPA